MKCARPDQASNNFIVSYKYAQKNYMQQTGDQESFN
jgi:hypothetical protein